MADATRAISLYAVRMRVARLNASGAPLVGADNLYVTSSMVRVDYTPTYATTDAVTKTNGRGEFCLNVPGKRKITGGTLTVEVCEDDPALIEMLAGGSVLVATGSDIVGYQFPKSDDPDQDLISIEVWTEAWVGTARDAALPYFWHAFPSCSLAQDQRSLSAAPDDKTFEGTANENPNWGTGPTYDWTQDSGAFAQFVRTAVAPPAVTDGYAPILADT